MAFIDADLHYWAGVFDYRGTICMRKITGRPISPYIAVKHTSAEGLQPLVDAFGGTIKKSESYFVWCRTHLAAREVILALAPHMQFRKDIIKEVLEWWPHRIGEEKKPRTLARYIAGSAMSGGLE